MNELEIIPGRFTPSGNITLTVRIDGSTVDVRQINITNPDDRDAFVNDLIARQVGIDPSEITEALIGIASDVAADSADSADQARRSQATVLIDLVKESGAELFHDLDGTAYATINIEDHRETHRLSSRSFKRWLGQMYFRTINTAVNAQAMTDATTTLEGIARFEGPELETSIRVAARGESIVIDLGDRDWSVVVVDANGWRVGDSRESSIRFRRASGMRPLPMPERGGSLQELRRLINIGDDEQWALLLGWLVSALRPIGPYPVLAVHGRHGSAKSTLCRFVRALVDPSSTPLRRPPKEERDLMVAASNSWVVAYDNLSGISQSLSDGLCVLATGGGFGIRELYSDSDECLFHAVRPTMVNGIDDLAIRPDLLDRCLNLTLPVILEQDRRDEEELKRTFNSVAPRIFGALLDAVSAAIRNLPTVSLERRPRMADFAKWSVAAESALGLASGAFLSAYLGNRDDSSVLAVESSAIGAALVTFMSGRNEWRGTATQLLDELSNEEYSTDRSRRQKDWPKSARAVRSALERLAPNLSAIDINVSLPSHRTGKSKERIIVIEKAPARPVTRVGPAANPPPTPKNEQTKDPSLGNVGSRPAASAADGSHQNPPHEPESPTSTHAAQATGRPGPSDQHAADSSAAINPLVDEPAESALGTDRRDAAKTEDQDASSANVEGGDLEWIEI